MDIEEFRLFVISELRRMKPDSAAVLDRLSAETDLITSGIVDSHDFIDLCLAIEEKTGVFIDLAELEPEQFSTVLALHRHVDRPV